MMTKLVCVVAGLFAISLPAGAFPSVTKIADTTVDSQAMTLSGGTYGYAINGLSFQQNLLMSFNGWQYAAYYDGSGHVCVARRNLGNNNVQIGTAGTLNQTMFSLSWGGSDWEVLELTDYTISTTGDAHNVVTMGICPNDGTIHLAFDHHGHPLHYRVSTANLATDPTAFTWDASLFGPIHSDLISGDSISGVTYPRFWQTPSGDMQFGYRYGGSGDGDWYIVDYTGDTGLWSSRRQVINRSGTYSDSLGSSDSRNAYMNPPGYSPNGNLHVTWTWRESAGGANHDIMYAYSDDNGVTWYNNAGSLIGDSSSGDLISIQDDEPAPGLAVATLDRAWQTMNQQAQAIDSNGRVHSVMFHCTSPVGTIWGTVGDRRYYHYWRDAGGAWHENQLYFNTSDVSSYVGQRPKLFIRSNGDAYVIYQAWQSVSLSSTGLYVHDGDLVIQAATEANDWTDWQIIHVESGPFLSEALADPYRFEDGILSVVMQDSPSFNGQSTPLRVLEFQMN